MRKKIIIPIFILVLILVGCGNSGIQDNKDDVYSSSKEMNFEEPFLVLGNKYNVIYNSSQKENKNDRDSIDNSLKTLTENFEKLNGNINKKQDLNVIPLSYTVIKNPNSKILGLNLLVVNTSDKIITDFSTTVNYTFKDSSFTYSHSLEMKEVGVNKLEKNEAVLISYATDIKDEFEEYFDNFNIEDVTIKLTDLTVTTE